MRRWQPLWLAGPSVIIVVASEAFVLMRMFVMSVQDPHFVTGGAPTYVGLSNFVAALTDPQFADSLKITSLFVLLTVPSHLIFGTLLAVLFAREHRVSRLGASLIMLPWAVPPIVVAIIWHYLLTPGQSPINNVLGLFRYTGAGDMLSSPDWALVAVTLATVWWATPLYFLMLQARIKGIPQDSLDAAKVDGASEWQGFQHITLPELHTTLVTIAVFDVLGTAGLFDIIWVMTQGGPLGATATLPVVIYQTAFQNFDFGLASAVSVLTVAALFLTASAIWLIGREREA